MELQALLSEAVGNCRGAATERGVSLRTVLPTGPIDIEVDPARLHQVVANLLNNAIKFTAGGGAVEGEGKGVDFIVRIPLRRADGPANEPMSWPSGAG